MRVRCRVCRFQSFYKGLSAFILGKWTSITLNSFNLRNLFSEIPPCLISMSTFQVSYPICVGATLAVYELFDHFYAKSRRHVCCLSDTIYQWMSGLSCCPDLVFLMWHHQEENAGNYCITWYTSSWYIKHFKLSTQHQKYLGVMYFC